jgi:hypothetical protein
MCFRIQLQAYLTNMQVTARIHWIRDREQYYLSIIMTEITTTQLDHLLPILLSESTQLSKNDLERGRRN